MRPVCNLIVILGFMFSMITLKAQDPMFSQFYAAPSYVNPAMIGFSDAPRVNLNFRDQLASFSNAYVTTNISYDQHFHKYNSSIGLSLMADRAGGLLNSYWLSGIYAYQLRLNKKLTIKAGVEASYFNKHINTDELVFADDIDPNGTITPGGSAIIEDNNIHRFDLSVGALAYTKRSFIGISVKHLTSPNVSFTGIDDPDNELKVRSSLHFGTTFYLENSFNKKSAWYITPNFLFVNQGRHFQINGGAYLGKGAVFGGLWVRHTIYNFDALIALLGVKVGVFKIGYSYDILLSGLKSDVGSHEFSLTFDFGQRKSHQKWERMQDDVNCPMMFRP